MFDTYDSNQGEIWDEIRIMEEDANVRTQSGAMRDIYESKKVTIEEYVKGIMSVTHQRGLLTYVDGRIVGFDILSKAEAYNKLHEKLLKSYAMDALLSKNKNKIKVNSSKAKVFLNNAILTLKMKYSSPGMGWDYRCHSEKVVGSALTYRNNVIHAAFFSYSQQDQDGMSSAGRRGIFRA